MALTRAKLAGDPPALDDPAFVVAARVAEIEDHLEADELAPRWSFTRGHVEDLRQAGATREQVAEYAATIYPPQQVRALLSDLGSYGPWTGDEATDDD